MKKFSKQIISILLAIILIVSTQSISIASKHSRDRCDISNALLQKINSLNDSECVPVYIWFDDINVDSLHFDVEKELGYSQTDIEERESKIQSIDNNIFTLNDEDFCREFSKYIAETKSERNEILEMENRLIQAQRDKVKEEYYEYNCQKLNKIGIEIKNIAYVSRFSPVLIAKLTKNEIDNISKNENVIYLGYYSDETPIKEFACALPAVQADYTKNTIGLTGYNVKVGMFDAGRVGTHSELSGSNITRLDSGRAVAEHATDVSRVIVGSNSAAPDCHLYSSSSENYVGAYLIAIEDLISQGVSVINISMGFGRNANDYYTDLERWFDHVVYQHNVSIVTSAGNAGLSSTVGSPGLAFNVITVGATDTLSTTNRNDDILATYTSTLNGGNDGCAKPDLLAPGNFSSITGSGTSLSAPLVTSLIAQMIELKPSIASSPVSIKAILNSSTDKKVIANSSEAWEGPLTPQQGAGQVNAKRAISLLSGNRYTSGTFSSGNVTKQFSVSSSDSYIRCNVSWLRSSIATNSHTSVNTTVGDAANLRLQCLNPSGNSVGSSNFTNSSVELVHFSVNSTYGTYTAKAIRMDAGTNSIKYAMAWF